MARRFKVHRFHTSRLAVFLAAVAFGLLAGCTFLPFAFEVQEAPREPFAAHRPAMRAAFVADLSVPQLRGAPEYALTMTLKPETQTLTGTAVITATNRTPTPWTAVALRTFPNLPHYAGSMRLLSVRVNGQSAGFTSNKTNTAVLVDLVNPLAPGKRVRITVDYEVRYESVSEKRYLLFGEQNGIINLPLAYPVLAAPDGKGGWRLDDGIPLGDTLTAETSFFEVWLTLPQGLELVSSGVIVGKEPLTQTQTVRYKVVSGPAREFIFLVSRDYQAQQVTADDVRVRSFYLPGDDVAGRAALRYAVAALQVYSRHFGPYPFAKLDVAVAMLLNRGMEYPMLNLFGIDLYREEQRKLEFLIAHEVAHQWWYNMVGNDQVREPWLDEGLTEYSTYLYYEDIYGKEEAEALRVHRWVAPVNYIRNRGLDAPLGLPATAYSSQNYEQVVYAKGALFFHELRQRLGDEAFHAALRAYLERFKYRLATSSDLEAVFEEVGGTDIRPVFATWVYGTSSAEP